MIKVQMSKVFKIGIAKNNNEKIKEVEEVVVSAGKGIVGDRHFHDFNDVTNQITLIEKENIDYYNNENKLNISYVDFRRNIITEGIQLNNLIGKKIKIGNVLLLGNDLCRPCKHLQESLNRNDIIKEFLKKGGLRCEILNSGTITLNKLIEIIA